MVWRICAVGSVIVAPEFREKSVSWRDIGRRSFRRRYRSSGRHRKEIRCGERTHPFVDRLVAESCPVGTGETVRSRVLVQMALCARYGVIRVALRAASNLPEGEISSAAFAP